MNSLTIKPYALTPFYNLSYSARYSSSTFVAAMLVAILDLMHFCDDGNKQLFITGLLDP